MFLRFCKQTTKTESAGNKFFPQQAFPAISYLLDQIGLQE